MLVTGPTASLQVAFGGENVIEIPVSAAQLHAAQAFVGRSLLTQNGAIAPLRAGPYESSFYYSTLQRYSAVHTCNTWAAEALKAAGLPVHSLGVDLSGQLWIQARRLGHGQDNDSTLTQ
jgi:hypothetical protein